MIKEETLKHQKGRKNTVSKNMGEQNRFLLFEFSKLCLMVKAQIITLYDMFLNVYRGNI